MKRIVLTKYEDFLPEILIEAQSCDNITALAALRRTIEELAMEHDFFTETLYVNTTAEENEDWVKVSLGSYSLLKVLSVQQIVDDNEAEAMDVYWHMMPQDMLWIRNTSRTNSKEEVSFKIVASFLPDVDSEITQRDIVTKWRKLIVAKTLEDLFSMEGQPWANASRFQVYAMKSAKYLEDFIYTEQLLGHDNRSLSSALPRARNIFC